MNYDTRFALIDADGDERFAAIIKGTYQIGKESSRRPVSIHDFAKAILTEGEGGRFVSGDGRKHGILKFSGHARQAVSYRLNSAVAAQLGLTAFGKR
ncbi:hypothetical protein SAMN05444678_10930 [Sphingomonas sp. YR710]|uniref:hypothetical protein n=1 Tax=Sphingomonas sp. YR710 TaxID=1882773 RepID=UPI0008883C02|nr:hypothetical protein [Sphingomonas sp. YR710]SDD10750.1 hypothetical protein SAMN05444678_10930 [Sphingomonas sp. YR710]